MRRAGPVSGADCGIVLAHGRGGTADDILGVLAAAGLRDVAAVAPQAPGQSWWPTSFLAPSAVIERHVRAGLAAMLQGVATLEAAGIDRSRIWLGGFSQGAGLALETFARSGAGLAGCFGLSGGLVGTADAGTAPDPALHGHTAKRFDYAGTRTGARVWISVHAQDPHIPVRRVEETAQVLSGLGALVQSRVYPGAGHAVRPEDLAALRDWLAG